MVKEGVVVEALPGKYRLSTSQMPSYEGVVDLVPSGAAYVKVEGFDKDVYIDGRNTNHALQDDVVKLVVIRRKRNGDPEGEITEIVKRADRQYVGRVELTRNHAFVRVDSRKMPYDIFVYTKGMELHDGDKVVVKIKEWPADTKSPTGEIIDVLGPAGDNDTEMHAILAEFNLPYKYPEEVEKAADAIPELIPAEEIARRRDFRGVTTFTIDPADAKDFDDALSIRPVGENRWEVGVHIADVTYYVQEESIIEAEGRERATSVYLVDRTIPMLPEKLSNYLCSLRPDEEKLCFSAVFEMDADLNITNEWLGRTVIPFRQALYLRGGAAHYRNRRGGFQGGGAHAEHACPEDACGAFPQRRHHVRPRGGEVYPRRARQTHRRLFQSTERGQPAYRGVHAAGQPQGGRVCGGKKRGKGANAERTFVYRVHDKPDPDKLERFSNFILKFGYYFKSDAKGKEISREINRLLKGDKGQKAKRMSSRRSPSAPWRKPTIRPTTSDTTDSRFLTIPISPRPSAVIRT